MLCKCRICKKVFPAKRKIYCCEDCKEANEQVFNLIEEYLGSFPNSNALQISEFLKIRPELILSFVDEGRLSVASGHFEKIH